MKKILFLFFTITLSVGFIGCSNDDDSSSRTEYADKIARYNQLQIDIEMYEEELAERREMIKRVWHDRSINLQKLMSEEERILEDMKQELSVLKEELSVATIH